MSMKAIITPEPGFELKVMVMSFEFTLKLVEMRLFEAANMGG
jgi:hypothetical protein